MLAPKSIDWQKIEKIHEHYKDKLKDLAQYRKELISKYPILIVKRKKAKFEYMDALQDSKLLMEKISTISKEVEFLRVRWYKNGGNKDNFYLNMEANKKLYAFNDYRNRKEVIFTQPRETEKEFIKNNRNCEDCIKAIHLAKHNYREIQRLLNHNLSIEVIKEYEENITNSYEIYVVIQRFQVSIKKRKYFIANEIVYVKEVGRWFKINMKNDEKSPITSTNLVQKIKNKIKKWKGF
jgi:hypothetical protein